MRRILSYVLAGILGWTDWNCKEPPTLFFEENSLSKQKDSPIRNVHLTLINSGKSVYHGALVKSDPCPADCKTQSTMAQQHCFPSTLTGVQPVPKGTAGPADIIKVLSSVKLNQSRFEKSCVSLLGLPALVCILYQAS